VQVLQHTTPYIVKAAWHLVGDIDLLALVLAGQTMFATTQYTAPVLSLPTSEDRLFCGATVEQHDSSSWLCDDNGDNRWVLMEESASLVTRDIIKTMRPKLMQEHNHKLQT